MCHDCPANCVGSYILNCSHNLIYKKYPNVQLLFLINVHLDGKKAILMVYSQYGTSLLSKNNDFLQYNILRSKKKRERKEIHKILEGHIGFLIDSTIIDFYLRHFYFCDKIPNWIAFDGNPSLCLCVDLMMRQMGLEAWERTAVHPILNRKYSGEATEEGQGIITLKDMIPLLPWRPSSLQLPLPHIYLLLVNNATVLWRY